MNIVKTHSGLFYKYLLSYITIFTIPLVVFAFISYSYYLGAYEEELKLNNKRSLEMLCNTLDTQLKQIDSIAYQIATGSEFKNFYSLNGSTVYYEAVGRLQNYNMTNEFIDEIVFIPRNSDLLYTSLTSAFKDSYAESKYLNWPGEDFSKTVDTAVSPCWRPSEDVNVHGRTSEDTANVSYKKYITEIYPLLSISTYKTDATMLFQVDEANIRNLVRAVNPDLGGNFLIMDKKGAILFSYNGNYPEATASLLTGTTSRGLQSSNIKLNKRNLTVSTIHSQVNDWTYVNVMVLEESLKKFNRMRTVFIIAIFLIIIIGITAVYLFMSLNYNPLKQLKTHLQNTTGISPEGSNEIEAAKLAITYLQQSKQDVIENSRESIKETLLFKLLKGEFDTIQEFNTAGRNIGLKLSREFYSVLHILVEDNSSMETHRELVQYMENALKTCYEVFDLNSLDKSSIIYILASSDPADEVLAKNLMETRDELFRHFNVRVTICAGNTYNSTADIYKSYIEAITATRYKLVKGTGSVILYSDVPNSRKEGFIYPKSELEALQDAIKSGNAARLDFILQDLVRIVRKEGNSLFAAICLSYDVINTIIKTLSEARGDYASFLKQYPDLLSGIKPNSVEDLADTLQSLSSQICRYIEENTGEKEPGFMDRITGYINANYTSTNFSIQALADYMGVSISNLSQQFKNKSGQNISDYVNSIRLEKAKELLRSTDLPLSEITKAIGYLSSNSFINKFKQLEGRTPGEYRNVYKK